jgi:hypothetical protein
LTSIALIPFALSDNALVLKLVIGVISSKDYITVEFDILNGTIHQFISFRVCVIPNKHAFGVCRGELCSCLGWLPKIAYASKDLKMENLRFLPILSLF